MTINPLVTVVVPAYNAERYLTQCIESIRSQEYQNLEIIIVDDGSTDGTRQICEDFSAKDSRVVVIPQKNAGVSFARNIGIRKASGDYIQFVDADDVLRSDAIKRLVHCIVNTSADAVCFDYWEFTSDDDIWSAENKKNELREYDVLDRNAVFRWIHRGLIKNNVWAFFFKRDFLLNEGLLFDTTIPFGEDILFLYRAASVMNRLVFLPAQLYGYRNNPQSAVHQRSIEFAESDLHVVSKLDAIQQKQLGLDPEGYHALRKRLLVDAYLMLPHRRRTGAEQCVVEKVRDEFRHMGIVQGLQGLNTRYALLFLLIYANLFDFVYPIHAFIKKIRHGGGTR
ncbi:glycosyltransferase family 2 protein [Pseudoscardovia suis]